MHIIFCEYIIKVSFSSGLNYSVRWYLHIYCLVPVARFLSIAFIILGLFFMPRLDDL